MPKKNLKIGNVELGKTPVVTGTVSGDVTVPFQDIQYVDIIEARIDKIYSIDPMAALAVLKSLKDRYRKPVIATVRSKMEGGAIDINDEIRYELYQAAMPFVDAVDVEISSRELMLRVGKLCSDMGKILIGSYHNHIETPDDEILSGILSEGKKAGADIVKIAVTARNRDDVGKIICYTFRNRDLNIVTMAQGEEGTLTRIVNPIIGSLMTYGFIDEPAAKGQLSAMDLINYIRKFDREYQARLGRSC